MNFAESKNPRPNGQDVSSWNQLQLQSYCSSYVVYDLLDIQRYEGARSQEQPPTLGSTPEDMATDYATHYRLCLAGYVSCGNLRLLERRSQACGKSCHLLHVFLNRLLHIRNHHVDRWCRSAAFE